MIAAVREEDLPDLLPLLRAYCDFYEVAPSDDALLALCRALLDDALREGVQLLARDEETGAAVGGARGASSGRPPRTTTAPRPSTAASAASGRSGSTTV